MKDQSVAVIGAGVIGIGVAQSCAQAAYRVTVVDVSDEVLDRARKTLAAHLKAAALYRTKDSRPLDFAPETLVEFTKQYDRVRDADLVIENTIEDLVVKARVYQEIDAVCKESAIFAANTSAIPITRLAAFTKRPERVIGIHFMNPVPMKPFVEMIRGWHTSPETVDAAVAFLQDIGKTPIMVEDVPGFVSNRIMMLTVNEAILSVQDRVASPHDVDTIFVKCFSHKMGPLATADLIGLDTILLTLENLYQAYGDSKYSAAPLLRQMVSAGLLGRKSGKGFFSYPTEGRK